MYPYFTQVDHKIRKLKTYTIAYGYLVHLFLIQSTIVLFIIKTLKNCNYSLGLNIFQEKKTKSIST